MINLEAGKYYYCTACCGFWKRTKKAVRPYLPCGHFPEYIREITREQYLALKEKKKVVSQGNLESLRSDFKPDDKRMKEIEVKLSVLDYTLASLMIKTKFAAEILG